MVAPAVAVCGGGAIAGVGGFVYAGEVNKGEYKMLKKGRRKLEAQLGKLRKGLEAQQPLIDKVEKKLSVK